MQRIIIGIIIIILCLIVGITSFGWPKYKDFNAMKLELETSKVDLDNKQKYVSELNSVWARLQERNIELSKVDSALSATSVAPELVNFLAEKSLQNGLILEKVDVGKASFLMDGSKIKKVSLNLNLSGFYPALRNFISTIQKSAKIIEIDSINFSEAQKGDIFSFTLGVSTYSY